MNIANIATTFPYVFWQEEHDFWKKLLERYLAPIVDDKAHKEEVTRELKSLRNKVGFYINLF